ncbi:hypothetical protein BTVI_149370 [Pitangus sulphuratus]|nr:hypothetical protein BTVI_149370 [Pitangus sulphuratus]
MSLFETEERLEKFLYPVEDRNASTESRLLLVSEDKYIEQFDIRVVTEEHKVVIQKSGQLPRAKVADDLVWAQWDMMEQRLFYIVPKLESHLDISVNDTQLKLVNFGYDCCQDQDVASRSLNLQVFTSKAGGLCVCCSLASDTPDEIMYSIYFLHKGYNKTFTVSLERTESHQLKEVAFMNLDYYVAAYLPGQFLHLLNIQHPDLLCHSLFLTGEDARIDTLQNCSIRSPLVSTVLDCKAGSLYAVSISDSTLLRLLQRSKQDSERLAALHCALLYFQHTEDLEMQVVPGVICATDIISLPVLEFQNPKGFWEKLNSNLESVKYAEPHLHYHNNVLRREWRNLSEEMVAQLKDHLMRHLHDERGSAGEFAVFHIMSRILEAANGMCMPLPPGFHTLHLGLGVRCLPLHTLLHYIDIGVLQLTETCVRKLLKVLSFCFNFVWNERNRPVSLTSWPGKVMEQITPNAIPRHVQTNQGIWPSQHRFMEDRCCLTNLVSFYDLVTHLVDEGKAVGIVYLDFSKIFDTISHIILPEKLAAHGLDRCTVCWVKSVWSARPREWWGMELHPAGSWSPVGYGVTSCWQLVTSGVPQGSVLGPGLLHISVGSLNKGNKCIIYLDDTEQNEKLKFSIVMRLPEALGQKVRQFWNHPINANLIARKYVKLLLENLGNRQCTRSIPERFSVPVEFLPLNYLTSVLTEIENQGVRPYEKQDHVNARFVEEVALKHTMTLLGLKYS